MEFLNWKYFTIFGNILARIILQASGPAAVPLGHFSVTVPKFISLRIISFYSTHEDVYSQIEVKYVHFCQAEAVDQFCFRI